MFAPDHPFTISGQMVHYAMRGLRASAHLDCVEASNTMLSCKGGNKPIVAMIYHGLPGSPMSSSFSAIAVRTDQSVFFSIRIIFAGFDVYRFWITTPADLLRHCEQL